MGEPKIKNLLLVAINDFLVPGLSQYLINVRFASISLQVFINVFLVPGLSQYLINVPFASIPLQVFSEDLFGETAEEKDVAKIQSKVVEARSQKSYDAFCILAQYVSEKYLLNLVLPAKDVSYNDNNTLMSFYCLVILKVNRYLIFIIYEVKPPKQHIISLQVLWFVWLNKKLEFSEFHCLICTQ